MHEWHTNNSVNPMKLINEFLGYAYETDYAGWQEVDNIKITNKIFPTHEDAITYVTDSSYHSGSAWLAAYAVKKLSKGYQAAFNTFVTRYNEWINFEKNLTIAYGRKSSKATCPHCGSSIALKYGAQYKRCPVCGSKEIISDSNWKMLETKKRMCEKSAENLSKEAVKSGLSFVCGIEWHC